MTTLHETEPATLENAMIYSDNIYFAKVALKLGENNLTSFLEKLGFNKEIPFDIKNVNITVFKYRRNKVRNSIGR